MVVSAHLPYFIPYPGYFVPFIHSDVFVILDSVQFPQGRSWVSRNLLKNDQGRFWLSVPVRRKGLGLQRINQVKLLKEGNWAKKFIRSIETAYNNAPFLEDHMPFIKQILNDPPDLLINLNLMFLDYLLSALQIKTEVVMLSHLGIEAKEPELSYLIAKELKAKVFAFLPYKRKFLDESLFQNAGIGLRVLRYRPVIYPQLWGDFLQNLSILDLLFNCGPKARSMLSKA